MQRYFVQFCYFFEAFATKNVTNIDDIFRTLAEWPIEKPLKMTVVRGKEKLNIVVVPVEAR